MSDLTEIIKAAEEPVIEPEEYGPVQKHERVRPDPKAIANLHALQANRPLKPPGRS